MDVPPNRTAVTDGDDEITIDELARVACLPVRTIREYQTMRLLPPPVRRGRVGMYGEVHRDRLALVARLQRRGYSLAGIGDLLASFEAGANLPALLGMAIGPAALDEVPLRLTREELVARLPNLKGTALQRAGNVGLVWRDGRDYFVRSPALLTLVADAVELGVDVSLMLDLVADVVERLDGLASAIADRLVTDVWTAAASQGSSGADSFLLRGRPLLLQAVASVLADRLGTALRMRAANSADKAALLEAIERIRVGAVVDGSGNLERRRPG